MKKRHVSELGHAKDVDGRNKTKTDEMRSHRERGEGGGGSSGSSAVGVTPLCATAHGYICSGDGRRARPTGRGRVVAAAVASQMCEIFEKREREREKKLDPLAS